MDTLFIVLEDEDNILDYSVAGEFLLESLEELDDVAEEAGVKPLSRFISPDPDALETFLESEEEDDVTPPPVDYFPAEAGLMTVRALLARIAANPKCISRSEELTVDLNNCEGILTKAWADGIHWRFEVDFWEEEDQE